MHEQWAERFWARVQKSDAPGACWLWNGSRLPAGYGRFYPRWKVGLYAHRVSWEIANGQAVPTGLEILHACDTPECVNPAHLSIGTRSDNVRDCVAKGRHGHGSLLGDQHPNSKLTEAQVAEIKRRLRDGAVKRALARELGVSKATIQHIATRRSWRHVEGGS